MTPTEKAEAVLETLMATCDKDSVPMFAEDLRAIIADMRPAAVAALTALIAGWEAPSGPTPE